MAMIKGGVSYTTQQILIELLRKDFNPLSFLMGFGVDEVTKALEYILDPRFEPRAMIRKNVNMLYDYLCFLQSESEGSKLQYGELLSFLLNYFQGDIE